MFLHALVVMRRVEIISSHKSKCQIVDKIFIFYYNVGELNVCDGPVAQLQRKADPPLAEVRA